MSLIDKIKNIFSSIFNKRKTLPEAQYDVNLIKSNTQDINSSYEDGKEEKENVSVSEKYDTEADEIKELERRNSELEERIKKERKELYDILAQIENLSKNTA